MSALFDLRGTTMFYAYTAGTIAADAGGDGSFAVRDEQGRKWVCYELRESTREELIAKVRGEFRTPSWRGPKQKTLTCDSLDELRQELSKPEPPRPPRGKS
jgi:hypothetical protein